MFAKLIMVTAVNNNKFYIMQSNPDTEKKNQAGQLQRGFFKIPLTESLVGLAIVHSVDFFNLLVTMNTYMEMYGFYSKHTKTLYFKDSFRYVAEFWDAKRNRPGHFLEYEPLPYKEMEAYFCQMLTKKLSDSISVKGNEVSKEDMEEAKVAFFYDEATLKRLSIDKKTAGIHPSDIHDVLCQTTTNQDVELYLTHPDEWFDKISAKVLKIEGDRLCQLFRRRLSLQQILQKVWKEPLHPWNQAMKLAHTVRDKATVVLTVEKDGKTECFRVKTNGLLEHSLGQYDDRCILPKDRQLLREKYDTKCYRFSIANIKKATYKNRVIFKA